MTQANRTTNRRLSDGLGLLGAFRGAVANLAAHVDEVNALNVFPVPDGDTGSNMLATVRAALAEAEAVPEATADRVAQAISFGALMGARGNSGVIASQVFRGMTEGLGDRQYFDGADLARALTQGTATAYKAVVKPVEGTILTVIREAAAAASAVADDGGDLEAVLTAAVQGAEKAVASTPTLLPILAEAGVVDAGGQGLYRLLQGAHAYLMNKAVVRAQTNAATEPGRAPATAVPPPDEGFGYETMFLLHANGRPLDVDALRNELKRLGDSVLVAGDSRAVKVHVHNDRPDRIIALGLSLGALTRITVENLDAQSRDVREKRASEAMTAGLDDRPEPHAAGLAGPRHETRARVALETIGAGSSEDAAPAAAPRPNGRRPHDMATLRHGSHTAALAEPAPELPLAVVAVTAGQGLARIFESFGVAAVVRGGQSSNPSTGELLDAVARIRAREILLLPNNPNVILAARQASELSGRLVRVVPTRNAAEGFAALLALDPERDATANAEVMALAGRAVQTLQVTQAVRDAVVGGHKVKEGQTIVLDPDDGLLAVNSNRLRAILAALEALEPGFELVTLYYGDGADQTEAEATAARIREWRPRLEVEVLAGGQPYYRYLIAAE